MILSVTLLALAPPQEYLTEIVRPVVERPGTAAEIASTARRCVAEHLGSGRAGGELIISDSDNIIVSRSALSYRDGLASWQVRSRFTVEARDGRFRVTQSGLERLNDAAGGWGPIGKWWGSGWQKAEQAFNDSAQAVEACIARPEAPADDW